METFGVTSTTGYSQATWLKDYINSNQPVSPTYDGTAKSISMYCYQAAENTGNIVFSLMEYTESPIATLVASTNSIPITTTEGWHTASFVNPPKIYSDKTYYICVNCEPTTIFIWTITDDVDGMIDHAYVYTGGYPETVESWDLDPYNKKICLYCSYDLDTVVSQKLCTVGSGRLTFMGTEGRIQFVE